MPVSTAELNRIANDVTASAMTARAHSGNPGANGTANRIGTASANLASGSWSAGARWRFRLRC